MSLPKNCKHIPKECLLFHDHATASEASHDETPFFAVHDPSFLSILGPSPSITLGLEKDWPFAHEAAVYVPSQDACYITSNLCPASPPSDQPKIYLGKLTRDASSQTWTYETLSTDIAMGNGGINYPTPSNPNTLLFCDQGSHDSPPSLAILDPTPPYKTTRLLTAYHTRPFTSPNDVVIHSNGSIWFTDPIYGHEQGFRPTPSLPSHVWRLDPESGELRPVADGFGRCNGVCFSPDEETLYVTDTDWIHGDGTTDHRRSSNIYAFDVIERHGGQFLTNRRLFAMADCGIPDGIKTDLHGNVYSGTWDGISVWSPAGRLLGKIRIPGGVANFCFARRGELLACNEKRFWVVKISEGVEGALLRGLGIEV
ncbi:unnamed protein product [Zymoseptoria tritici ST99CH_3D1]|nr:unnamed protein product [Zymoseptoria tritici ST99CH_3D1]